MEGEESGEGRSEPAGVIDALKFSIFSTKYFRNFSQCSAGVAQTVAGAEFTRLLMEIQYLQCDSNKSYVIMTIIANIK